MIYSNQLKQQNETKHNSKGEHHEKSSHDDGHSQEQLPGSRPLNSRRLCFRISSTGCLACPFLPGRQDVQLSISSRAESQRPLPDHRKRPFIVEPAEQRGRVPQPTMLKSQNYPIRNLKKLSKSGHCK